MASRAERLEQKNARLAAYLERERYMLSGEAVQSYGTATRNIQRYNTDLAEVRRAISALEEEIGELESAAMGRSPRMTARVVPRDW